MLDSIIALGIALISKYFGQEFAEKKEFTNQNL
jgi:hypothetical protein